MTPTRWCATLRWRVPPGAVQRRVIGTEAYRVGSWRGVDGEGYLAASGGGAGASVAAISQLTDELHERGYETVHTAAVAEDEIRPYLACGYQPREHLHLLRHDLRNLPSQPLRSRTRGARRRDRDPILQLDGRAFDRFWALDGGSLHEALTATPRCRFRVSVDANEVSGYAVTGRSGAAGYLQRLAVDPDFTGAGLGSALVADALHWLQRAGSTTALVNTQENNQRAFDLYLRHGFVRQPSGLVILSHRSSPT